ncbi:hypothetical protein [Saccharothrix obliqua]|uniref:hypothetical protein n=1 Tax=Saccharothrix obliqua TaxID=2861747 RepID=UPI001C5D12AC|nr:hypothetical protein [Saccharothrix obliqua]MBW4715528.1 hypothetical protein [Saccharothrix obliqua]
MSDFDRYFDQARAEARHVVTPARPEPLDHVHRVLTRVAEVVPEAVARLRAEHVPQDRPDGWSLPGVAAVLADVPVGRYTATGGVLRRRWRLVPTTPVFATLSPHGLLLGDDHHAGSGDRVDRLRARAEAVAERARVTDITVFTAGVVEDAHGLPDTLVLDGSSDELHVCAGVAGERPVALPFAEHCARAVFRLVTAWRARER